MKPNILFVCGRNKRRSPTAVKIYKKDQRFNVSSAAISKVGNHQVKVKDIQWADIIFVFENEYREYISSKFNENFPKIINLDIPDEFEYLDVGLIELIKSRTEYNLNILFRLPI